MDQDTLLRLLEDVKKGTVSPETASTKLARLPFEDIGFAKVDHHRSLRQGLPEDPELGHALDQFEVELVVDVVLNCDRQDTLVHEGADGFLDQALFVRELEVHEVAA